MKIDGPKGPDGTESVAPGGLDEADGIEGAGFDQLLDGAAGAGATDAPDALDELAARLQAGELDPDEAAAQVLEAVVQEQVEAAGLSDVVAEAMRDELRVLMAEDPVLQDMIERLTGG